MEKQEETFQDDGDDETQEIFMPATQMMPSTQMIDNDDEEEETDIQLVGKLELLKEDGSVQEVFNLKIGENRVGRDPKTCEVVISQPSLSRTHAVIEVHPDGSATVFDNGSSNGSRVGPTKIQMKPKVCYHMQVGDGVIFGNISCVWKGTQEISSKSISSDDTLQDETIQVDTKSDQNLDKVDGNAGKEKEIIVQDDQSRDLQEKEKRRKKDDDDMDMFSDCSDLSESLFDMEDSQPPKEEEPSEAGTSGINSQEKKNSSGHKSNLPLVDDSCNLSSDYQEVIPETPVPVKVKPRPKGSDELTFLPESQSSPFPNSSIIKRSSFGKVPDSPAGLSDLDDSSFIAPSQPVMPKIARPPRTASQFLPSKNVTSTQNLNTAGEKDVKIVLDSDEDDSDQECLLGSSPAQVDAEDTVHAKDESVNSVPKSDAENSDSLRLALSTPSESVGPMSDSELFGAATQGVAKLPEAEITAEPSHPGPMSDSELFGAATQAVASISKLMSDSKLFGAATQAVTSNSKLMSDSELFGAATQAVASNSKLMSDSEIFGAPTQAVASNSKLLSDSELFGAPTQAVASNSKLLSDSELFGAVTQPVGSSSKLISDSELFGAPTQDVDGPNSKQLSDSQLFAASTEPVCDDSEEDNEAADNDAEKSPSDSVLGTAEPMSDKDQSPMQVSTKVADSSSAEESSLKNHEEGGNEVGAMEEADGQDDPQGAADTIDKQVPEPNDSTMNKTIPVENENSKPAMENPGLFNKPSDVDMFNFSEGDSVRSDNSQPQSINSQSQDVMNSQQVDYKLDGTIIPGTQGSEEDNNEIRNPLEDALTASQTSEDAEAKSQFEEEDADSDCSDNLLECSDDFDLPAENLTEALNREDTICGPDNTESEPNIEDEHGEDETLDDTTLGLEDENVAPSIIEEETTDLSPEKVVSKPDAIQANADEGTPLPLNKTSLSNVSMILASQGGAGPLTSTRVGESAPLSTTNLAVVTMVEASQSEQSKLTANSNVGLSTTNHDAVSMIEATQTGNSKLAALPSPRLSTTNLDAVSMIEASQSEQSKLIANINVGLSTTNHDAVSMIEATQTGNSKLAAFSNSPRLSTTNLDAVSMIEASQPEHSGSAGADNAGLSKTNLKPVSMSQASQEEASQSKIASNSSPGMSTTNLAAVSMIQASQSEVPGRLTSHTSVGLSSTNYKNCTMEQTCISSSQADNQSSNIRESTPPPADDWRPSSVKLTMLPPVGSDSPVFTKKKSGSRSSEDTSSHCLDLSASDSPVFKKNANKSGDSSQSLLEESHSISKTPLKSPYINRLLKHNVDPSMRSKSSTEASPLRATTPSSEPFLPATQSMLGSQTEVVNNLIHTLDKLDEEEEKGEELRSNLASGDKSVLPKESDELNDKDADVDDVHELDQSEMRSRRSGRIRKPTEKVAEAKKAQADRKTKRRSAAVLEDGKLLGKQDEQASSSSGRQANNNRVLKNKTAEVLNSSQGNEATENELVPPKTARTAERRKSAAQKAVEVEKNIRGTKRRSSAAQKKSSDDQNDQEGHEPEDKSTVEVETDKELKGPETSVLPLSVSISGNVTSGDPEILFPGQKGTSEVSVEAPTQVMVDDTMVQSSFLERSAALADKSDLLVPPDSGRASKKRGKQFVLSSSLRKSKRVSDVEKSADPVDQEDHGAKVTCAEEQVDPTAAASSEHKEAEPQCGRRSRRGRSSKIGVETITTSDDVEIESVPQSTIKNDDREDDDGVKADENVSTLKSDVATKVASKRRSVRKSAVKEDKDINLEVDEKKNDSEEQAQNKVDKITEETEVKSQKITKEKVEVNCKDELSGKQTASPGKRKKMRGRTSRAVKDEADVDSSASNGPEDCKTQNAPPSQPTVNIRRLSAAEIDGGKDENQEQKPVRRTVGGRGKTVKADDLEASAENQTIESETMPPPTEETRRSRRTTKGVAPRRMSPSTELKAEPVKEESDASGSTGSQTTPAAKSNSRKSSRAASKEAAPVEDIKEEDETKSEEPASVGRSRRGGKKKGSTILSSEQATDKDDMAETRMGTNRRTRGRKTDAGLKPEVPQPIVSRRAGRRTLRCSETAAQEDSAEVKEAETEVKPPSTFTKSTGRKKRQTASELHAEDTPKAVDKEKRPAAVGRPQRGKRKHQEPEASSPAEESAVPAKRSARTSSASSGSSVRSSSGSKVVSRKRGQNSASETSMASTRNKRQKLSSSNSVDNAASASPSLRRGPSLSSSSGEFPLPRNNKPRVMFTGYQDDKDEDLIRDLGGSITDNISDCSVLVTDQIKRTAKFLCMVARGVPIVSPRWIKESKRSGCFHDPWSFILRDEAKEKQWGFKLEDTLRLAGRGKNKLLTGFAFHVTKQVKPPPDQFKEIIEAADGIYLSSPPGAGSNAQHRGTFIISCPEDVAAVRPLKRAGHTIMDKEFLLTGLLKYKLDHSLQLTL